MKALDVVTQDQSNSQSNLEAWKLRPGQTGRPGGQNKNNYNKLPQLSKVSFPVLETMTTYPDSVRSL
jgi:hypothetical protein